MGRAEERGPPGGHIDDDAQRLQRSGPDLERGCAADEAGRPHRDHEGASQRVASSCGRPGHLIGEASAVALPVLWTTIAAVLAAVIE